MSTYIWKCYIKQELQKKKDEYCGAASPFL